MEINTFGISSVIEEKENYKINFICATTYSLETDIIPALLVPLYPEELSILPRIISRARKDKRLSIFYDRNHLKNISFKNKKIDQLMKCLVNNCCKPVSVPDGCFHPKLILVCYESESNSNEYLYRLSVASRNLTKSSMDENIVILEANGSKHDCPHKDPGELLDILEELDFGDDAKLYFQYPLAKNALGNLRIINKMDIPSVKRLVCISPGFTETERLFGRILDKKFYHCDNSHAKVYHITRQDDSCELWLGSANCSSKGLGWIDSCNSEAVVKTKTNLSSDQFIGYLNEYTLIENPENKTFDSDPEKKGIEACLKAIKKIKLEKYEESSITASIELCPEKPNIDKKNIKFLLCEKADVFSKIINCPNDQKKDDDTSDDINYSINNQKVELLIKGVAISDISPIFTLVCKENNNNITRSLPVEMSKEVEVIYKESCEKLANDTINDIRLLISSLSSGTEKSTIRTRTSGNSKYSKSVTASNELYEMIFNLFANTPDESISNTVNSLNKIIAGMSNTNSGSLSADVKTLSDIINLFDKENI